MRQTMMWMAVAFLSILSLEAGAKTSGQSAIPRSNEQFRTTAETESEMDANLAPKFNNSMRHDSGKNTTVVAASGQNRLHSGLCPGNVYGELGWTAAKVVLGAAVGSVVSPVVSSFLVGSISTIVSDQCSDASTVITTELIDSMIRYIDNSIIAQNLASVDNMLYGAKDRMDEYSNPEDGEDPRDILIDLEEHYFEPLSQRLEMNATDDSTPFLGAPFGSFSNYPEAWSKKDSIESKSAYTKQHMVMLGSGMTFEAMNLHLSFMILKSVFFKDTIDATNNHVRMYWNFANTYQQYLVYLYAKWAGGWRETQYIIGSCDAGASGTSGCPGKKTCKNRWCKFTDDLQCMATLECDEVKQSWPNSCVGLFDSCESQINGQKSTLLQYYAEADAYSETKALLAILESQLEMIQDFTSRLYGMHAFALKWNFVWDGETVEGCMGFSEVSPGATITMSDCAATKPDQQFVIEVVDKEKKTEFSTEGLWEYNLVVVMKSRVSPNLVLTPQSDHALGWYGTQTLQEYVENDQHQQWILLEDGRMMNRLSKSSDPLCLAAGKNMYPCRWDTYLAKMYPYFEVTMTDSSFFAAIESYHLDRMLYV